MVTYTSLTFKMLPQNELIRQIIKQVPTTKPSAESAVASFRQTPMYSARNCNANQLSGALGEIYIQLSLQQICQERKVEDRVRFNPISAGEETQNFIFRRADETGTLKVWAKQASVGRHNNSEIDMLLVADGLPVLFEIKMREDRPGPGGIAMAMQSDKIEKSLRPIKEYFKTTEVGYALVVPPEQISSNDFVQRIFMREGGMLVPFPMTRWQFKGEVRRISEKYELLVI